jgi:hypothetical protein
MNIRLALWQIFPQCFPLKCLIFEGKPRSLSVDEYNFFAAANFLTVFYPCKVKYLQASLGTQPIDEYKTGTVEIFPQCFPLKCLIFEGKPRSLPEDEYKTDTVANYATEFSLVGKPNRIPVEWDTERFSTHVKLHSY